MRQRRIRAVFMRGGTSKAVMFRREDLPQDRAAWDAIFLSALGSPDGEGRQLDGMGGGVSSLSKVCIVGPPTHPDADVDYTFGQVAVRDALVDYSGSCGNMSSAIGPFALEEGMLPGAPRDGEVTVRIHDTNAGRIIVSRFQAKDGEALVEGDLVLDGVSGTGAPIRLDFMAPGGGRSGHLLPSGHAVDALEIPGLGRIAATMVDAASPCVFIRAESVGATATETPQQLDVATDLLERLDLIRRHAAVAMGLAKDAEAARAKPSLPRIAMLAPGREAVLANGRRVAAEEGDVTIRMISMGQPHRAVTATGALCLGVACRIPGSIAAEIAQVPPDKPIRIAHASGIVLVDAVVRPDATQRGGLHCEHATLFRTARRLFEGSVLVRGPAMAEAA
jgi:2-methylaconitate cis-trans-isomerase PrpF